MSKKKIFSVSALLLTCLSSFGQGALGSSFHSKVSSFMKESVSNILEYASYIMIGGFAVSVALLVASYYKDDSRNREKFWGAILVFILSGLLLYFLSTLF